MGNTCRKCKLIAAMELAPRDIAFLDALRTHEAGVVGSLELPLLAKLTNLRGSDVRAAAKGLVAAGLIEQTNEVVLPSDEGREFINRYRPRS
jgi:hypothetical protein